MGRTCCVPGDQLEAVFPEVAFEIGLEGLWHRLVDWPVGLRLVAGNVNAPIAIDAAEMNAELQIGEVTPAKRPVAQKSNDEAVAVALRSALRGVVERFRFVHELMPVGNEFVGHAQS